MSATFLFDQPTQPARRRLRLAQQAFRSADGLAKAGISDADRVAAVVQFDFSIETILRAVLFEAKHPRAKAEQKFKELLDSTSEIINKAGASDALGRGALEQVRSVRNAAQHEARVPTPVEVTECGIYTRDALVDIARIAWNADFLAADIDAVRSDRVRTYLHRAAEARSVT